MVLRRTYKGSIRNEQRIDTCMNFVLCTTSVRLGGRMQPKPSAFNLSMGTWGGWDLRDPTPTTPASMTNS